MRFMGRSSLESVADCVGRETWILPVELEVSFWKAGFLLIATGFGVGLTSVSEPSESESE